MEQLSPVKPTPSDRASPVDSTEAKFQALSPVKMQEIFTPPLPNLTDIPIPPPPVEEPEEKPDVSKLSYGKLSFFKKAISASLLDKASLTAPVPNKIPAAVKTEPELPILSPEMVVTEPPPAIKQNPVQQVSTRQPEVEQRTSFKPLDQSLEALQASIYQTFVPPGKPKSQKKRAKSLNEDSESPTPSHKPKPLKDGSETPVLKPLIDGSEHTQILQQNRSNTSFDVPEGKKRKLSTGPECSEKRKKLSDSPSLKKSQQEFLSAPVNNIEPPYSVVNNILLQQKSCSTPLSKPHLPPQPLSNSPLYREFNSKDGKLILRKEGSKPPKKSSNSSHDHPKSDTKMTLNNHIQMKCIESNAMLNISRDYADHKPSSPLTSKKEGSDISQHHTTPNQSKKSKDNRRISTSSAEGDIKMESKRIKQAKPRPQDQYKYSSELNTDEQIKAQAKQKDLINGMTHVKTPIESPKGAAGEVIKALSGQTKMAKTMNDPSKIVKTLNGPMKMARTLNDPMKTVKNPKPVNPSQVRTTAKTLNDPLKGRINEPMKSVHELNRVHGYANDLPVKSASTKKPSTPPTSSSSKAAKSSTPRPDKPVPNGVAHPTQVKGSAPSQKRSEKRSGDASVRPSSKPAAHSGTSKPVPERPGHHTKPNNAMPPKPNNVLSQKPNHVASHSPRTTQYPAPIDSQPNNQSNHINQLPQKPRDPSKTPQKPSKPRQEPKIPSSKLQTPLIKREKKPSGKATPKLLNSKPPTLSSPHPPQPQQMRTDAKVTPLPLIKTEPDVAPFVIKSEHAIPSSPKPTLSQISSTLTSSKVLPQDNLLNPKTVGESSSAEPIILPDPAKYVKVVKCNDGEATTVHLDMDEFNTLSLDEQNMVVDYFFEVTFGETDGLADNVMGIIHNGSKQMSNVLEHLAEYTPGLKIKHQVLGKKEIKTSTMKEYRDSVRDNFSRCVFHEGGLLQTSLVGTKNEESGGFFGDLIDEMDANPFLEASVPWGTLTHFAGSEPGLSSDGPIFWVRPGEQFSRATQTPRTHKGYRLLKSRETLIPDRTNPHADHSWEDGQTCATTGAGAFLQAVHYGEGYNPDNALKDVILFDSNNFNLLVSELQLDLYEPPMTQCEIWIEDAKLNHLQSLNVKYAKIRLKSNDIYFIPRNVIHQFKTVRACASVAWHSRLKMYYD